MPNSAHHGRRILLPALVAIVLTLELSAVALALDPRPVPQARPEAAAVSLPARTDTLDVARRGDDRVRPAASFEGRAVGAVRAEMRARAMAAAEAKAAEAKAAAAAKAAGKAAATAKSKATTPSPKPAASTAYRGTNHVWIPSLGINRSVAFFPCSRSQAPGHRVYRWGCAGRNNVYLFGHASSVMKPLHDAYVAKRLRKGMPVWYADGNGKVRRYVVSYWRVVRPDGDIGWAFAAQSKPSMTLQTCVGADSQYRLVVRLVAAG